MVEYRYCSGSCRQYVILWEYDTIAEGGTVSQINRLVCRNVEIENVNKQIGEKCGRTKWICLLDGLMCYEAPNLVSPGGRGGGQGFHGQTMKRRQ